MKKLLLSLVMLLSVSFCFALGKEYVNSAEKSIINFFENGSYVVIKSDNSQTIYVNKTSVHVIGITEKDFVIEYNGIRIKTSSDETYISNFPQSDNLLIMVRDVKLY